MEFILADLKVIAGKTVRGEGLGVVSTDTHRIQKRNVQENHQKPMM